jgi:integrase
MKAKGIRLWLRKPRYDAAGKLTHPGVWWICDGAKRISTGTPDKREAERALAKHINDSWQPIPQDSAANVMIADVLAYYAKEKARAWADPSRARSQLKALHGAWGSRPLSGVTAASCRQYAAARNDATARKQLETLRAAIRFYHAQGLCKEVPAVTLPPERPPRERWLTRDEVAKLLRHCWRHRDNYAGRMRHTRRHVARFILIAIYTGRRSSAITEAKLEPSKTSGWIDLEGGRWRPKPGRQSKKRQPDVPISPRLLAHLRRWRRMGAVNAVEWNGGPLGRMHYAFREAARNAGVPCTPHDLRRTATVWLLQTGIDPWRAAGYLGLTLETMQQHYARHSPDHLADAAVAIGFRQRSANDNRERNGKEMARRSRKK